MKQVAGVNSVKTNPYLAKILGIFHRASDPADQAAPANDPSRFLQELESRNSPFSQVSQARPLPVGGKPHREPVPAKSQRPTLDTVEISEEAYEAFRQMQKNPPVDDSQS
jgi:hypothetical protein